jgi:hypothetical protein
MDPCTVYETDPLGSPASPGCGATDVRVTCHEPRFGSGAEFGLAAVLGTNWLASSDAVVLLADFRILGADSMRHATDRGFLSFSKTAKHYAERTPPMNTEPTYNPYAAPAVNLPGIGGDVVDGEGGASYADERRSVLFLIFLSIITVGIYPVVWYLRRRRFLDSLHADEKMRGWAAAPLIALLVAIGVAVAITLVEAEGAIQVVRLIPAVVNLFVAFRVAGILRSDIARTGRNVHVSGAGTFFFGALYLQHVINEAASQPARRRA